MKLKSGNIIIVLYMAALLVISGCSTSKNTSQSRWWHSFNARYNTYYNGSMAYIEGYIEKEQSNKDNFTELLPLFAVANKNSREIGKSNFERTIEKCEKAIKIHSIKRRPVWDKKRKKTERDISWLNRHEYNPFLWKAWLLMGKAQFQEGKFEEASSTFSYMSKLYADQPPIYGKARAWLARCYTELGWIYDAEDVITKMRRDSIDWRAVGEWNCTYADYYLKQGRFEEAIPYLRNVIKRETRKIQKAREWFIMGQICNSCNKKKDAYKAYRKVISLNPPYELGFNARIAQTEAMTVCSTKQMVNKLKHMAFSDKNREYLDQIYYAIGNIYISQKDTINATIAYEKGAKMSMRNGIEKGVLLLHLGNIYWEKEKFSDARRCYSEAIGLLDKERNDYEQLSERSKILDELVPYTDAVDLQDSLQSLAKMSESERNNIIDKKIYILKKKQKEARIDSLTEATEMMTQGRGNVDNNYSQMADVNQPGSTNIANDTWYFYNPLAISNGKETFQKQWGKRENVDDWQRINKTIVKADYTDNDNKKDNDSIIIDNKKPDSKEKIVNDPYKREYYLGSIPMTDEQLNASNMTIEDGLFNSGVIFKDKLGNMKLSEKYLTRLANNYKDFKKMPDVYYHLFLLYSGIGNKTMANKYLSMLQRDFPKNEWTELLSDPYYAENAKYGVHIEDSLYAATYDAFKINDLEVVKKNSELSKSRFPMGYNRDKFLFIDGLRQLNEGDVIGCIKNMKDILEKYPKSGISEMAGMIVKGVNNGRKLHGGKLDIGDIWNRRNLVLEKDSDSNIVKTFTNERDVNFMFMLVYKSDTLNENQLLYDIAKYNFSNYLVRNFDINIIEDSGLRRMEIGGFRNYDEALQYARKLYSDKPVSKELNKCRNIIISENNIQLLGKKFSYNDYDNFYEKYFAPLKITAQPLLIDPEPIDPDKQMQEQEIMKEKDQKEKKPQKNEDNFYDDLEKILNE